MCQRILCQVEGTEIVGYILRALHHFPGLGIVSVELSVVHVVIIIESIIAEVVDAITGDDSVGIGKEVCACRRDLSELDVACSLE